MVYKNIEIHNVGEIVENENGSISWIRVPCSVYDKIESEQVIGSQSKITRPAAQVLGLLWKAIL